MLNYISIGKIYLNSHFELIKEKERIHQIRINLKAKHFQFVFKI